MRGEVAKNLDGASCLWHAIPARTWGVSQLCNVNVARGLENLCGVCCCFPECVGEAVRSDEAGQREYGLRDDTRMPQRRTNACASDNNLPSEQKVGEG